jgi:hypothetical protein
MKISRSKILFAAIIAVLLVLALWHRGKKSMETPPTSSIETNTVLAAIKVPGVQAGTPVYTTASSGQTVTNTTTALQDKGNQMKEGLASLNDIPIVFYGRLEDQFGSPVADAQIAGSVRIYNNIQSTVERLTTVSDENGMFQIKDGRGEGLGIIPKKEGYVLATTKTYFKYSYMYADHFIPDQSNPAIIKMWKLQGGEPLVSINQRYKFHYTDAPVNFDLLANKIVSNGGDIKITIIRSPGVVSERTLQDWSVQVEAVNGGLIESDGQEGVTYEAPESGYRPNDTFVMSTTPPHKWFGGFEQAFFFQSRNGQVYSKINFGISINQQPDDYVWVEFHGVANTNSSRNWEENAPK